MGLEKRSEAANWFGFFDSLQKEPTSVWSEPVSRVFELIKRYKPEAIIPKMIEGVPVTIFINSTKRGPALGGSRRMATYNDMANFYRDGLKLSAAMTYKAIFARLPLGGGKAVIYASPEEITPKFLEEYAKFLNEINTPNVRFFTGEDVGFGEDLVDAVAKHTPYIAGKSVKEGGLGDPSPITAEGIYSAIKAVVEQGGIFNNANLKEKVCAVQGAGKVALALIGLLLRDRVTVYFSEKDGDPIAEESAKKAEQLGAIRVAQEDIYSKPCHIFSPCAIGGVMNKRTIPKLSWMCKVVLGAANNILDAPEDGIELYKKRIFYAPDYVVNRWGLEWVALEKGGITDLAAAKTRLTDIKTDISNLFKVSREKDIAPSEVSDIISQRVLNNEAVSVEEALINFEPPKVC